MIDFMLKIILIYIFTEQLSYLVDLVLAKLSKY